jgi:hypothetical protein
MAANLADRLRHGGRTVATVAAWIRSRLDEDWHTSWESQLENLQRAWDSIGEPAYGVYNRELYQPIQRVLHRNGLVTRPRLPGSLTFSEEHWGPEHDRERRMWALLCDSNNRALGALVTRFYHDHTQLRLPRQPTIEAIDETDHERIRTIVLGDPVQWSS